MRRTEREMTDPSFMAQVLDEAGEIALGLNTGAAPHVLFVNHVRVDQDVYFHCAWDGRKIDLLRANPQVGFTAAVDIRVEGTTTRYRSVCGVGRAEFVDDAQLKDTVLKALARKFKAPCHFPLSPEKDAATAVVRIRIESLSGKYSRSDEGPRPMPHYER